MAKKDYKNFGCFGCGYKWQGWATNPKCPKCGKKKIKEELMALPEYSAEKKPSQKIINDIEKITESTIEIEDENLISIPIEIEKDSEASKIEVENTQDEEEVKYTCAYCDSEVQKGDLYCDNCGESLLWEHLQ